MQRGNQNRRRTACIIPDVTALDRYLLASLATLDGRQAHLSLSTPRVLTMRPGGSPTLLVFAFAGFQQYRPGEIEDFACATRGSVDEL